MDIGAFRDEIVRSVWGLEKSWQVECKDKPQFTGNAAVFLSTLLSAYDHPVILDQRQQAFRKRMVESALSQFGFELKDPNISYLAEQDTNREGLSVELKGGRTIEMRLDQAARVRRWGIEICPLNHVQANKVQTYMIQGAIRRLESNLHQIKKMCLSLTTGNLSHPDAIRWNCIGLGYYMEELILDILNEHNECARRANLHEDLFEWTDLRVKYPDLKRKNGARVQVRLSVSASKQVSPRHDVGAYVVLSPLKIAEHLGQLADGSKEGSIRDEFWDVFEPPPADEEELGRALQAIFRYALESKSYGPLGPMTRIPRPIREVIQTYVRSESLDSNENVRDAYQNKKLGTSDRPFYTRRIRPLRQRRPRDNKITLGNNLPCQAPKKPLKPG